MSFLNGDPTGLLQYVSGSHTMLGETFLHLDHQVFGDEQHTARQEKILLMTKPSDEDIIQVDFAPFLLPSFTVFLDLRNMPITTYVTTPP